MAAAADTPCPITSPTTSAIRPSDRLITSYQSPPTSVIRLPGTYRWATSTYGLLARAVGSSARCRVRAMSWTREYRRALSRQIAAREASSPARLTSSWVKAGRPADRPNMAMPCTVPRAMSGATRTPATPLSVKRRARDSMETVRARKSSSTTAETARPVLSMSCMTEPGGYRTLSTPLTSSIAGPGRIVPEAILRVNSGRAGSKSSDSSIHSTTSTTAPSQKSGIDASTSSWAVWFTSRVVPMRVEAPSSRASRLRLAVASRMACSRSVTSTISPPTPGREPTASLRGRSSPTAPGRGQDAPAGACPPAPRRPVLRPSRRRGACSRTRRRRT